jgi:methionyl-tRNA formyltransferase
MVVSQPDKKVGRHQVLTYTPVKDCALKYNIEVFQPIKIKEDYQKIIEVNPDIIITCAYGQIIPEELLNAPKLGCINVHASLLPRLRGGAPLHHAIIDGEDKTGVTIMYMDKKMDTGDIISSVEYKIKDTDTVDIIHDKLSKMGADLLTDTLPLIISGKNKRIKQDDNLATYAWNIKREEEHINFNNECVIVDRLVRGLNSWPLANTIINDIEYKVVEGYYELKSSIPNKIMEITKDKLGIGCLDGVYYITKIKPSGKKIMNIKDFLNGIDKIKFKDSVIR